MYSLCTQRRAKVCLSLTFDVAGVTHLPPRSIPGEPASALAVTSAATAPCTLDTFVATLTIGDGYYFDPTGAGSCKSISASDVSAARAAALDQTVAADWDTGASHLSSRAQLRCAVCVFWCTVGGYLGCLIVVHALTASMSRPVSQYA